MKCIVLAAGQGFQLDGCVKLLIKDPKTGEKIIDQLIKNFWQTKPYDCCWI